MDRRMDRPNDSRGYIHVQENIYRQLEEMRSPVLSIACPSAQEIQHRTNQIAQATYECQYLERKLEALYENAALVRSLLEAKKREIFEIRSRIAPLRRLPIEILSMVVSLHVRANLQPVWVLMQTNRAWRAAALLARDVWNNILICPPGSRWFHTEYARGGKQRIVCNSEEQLACALNRTGSMPLDVEVRLRILRLSFEDLQNAAPVLKLIESVPASARIRRLEFENDSTNLTEIYSTLSGAFQKWDLSHLEHLATSIEPLLTRAMREATGIKSIGGPASILRSVKGMARTQYIRHLDIWDFDGVSNLDHLTAFKALEWLSVTGNSLDHRLSISLPHLRSLQSSIQSPHWPITCANITHLDLIPQNSYRYYSGDVIHLPQLTHFSCKNSAFSRRPFLQHFKAPNLEVLEAVDHGNSQETTIQAMRTIWPPAETRSSTAADLDPTILKLYHVYVNAKLLSRVLLRFTRCVELHLLEMHVPVEFFELICPSSRKSRSETRLPTLKILVIDLCEKKGTRNSYGAGIEQAAYLDAAKQFLQRRRAMFKPLHILSISQYGGNKVFLTGDGE